MASMTNREILNALTVLRDVLKAAKLEYEVADRMIQQMKDYPVADDIEIERAFCAGFIANLHSMADFNGDSIIKKYKAYRTSGFYQPCASEPNI